MKNSLKMMAIAAFAILFGVNTSNAQTTPTITTIAGGTFDMDGGDGGPAYWATLHQPLGLAYDSLTGNLFVGCYGFGSTAVRVIDTSGIIRPYAGTSASGFGGDGGQATSAQLGRMVYHCVDGAGNVYLPDTDNRRLRKVNAAGIISTLVGNGIDACAGDGIPATSADIRSATGVVVDAVGNIYLGDQVCQKIWKINTAGIIKCFAGTGVTGYSGDGGPATNAKFDYIINLCLDKLGNLYVADVHNSRIRKIDTAGIVTTFAGTGVTGWDGDGAQATLAKIGWPEGLAFDHYGDLFFSDQWGDVVRMIDTNSVISTIAGNGHPGYYGDHGPASLSKLNWPSGLAFNKHGDLFVADNSNYAIRKISWDPISTETVGLFSKPATVATICTNEYVLNGIEVGSLIGIADMTGRTVYQSVARFASEHIRTDMYVRGMYVVKVIAPNGTAQWYRILKE